MFSADDDGFVEVFVKVFYDMIELALAAADAAAAREIENSLHFVFPRSV